MLLVYLSCLLLQAEMDVLYKTQADLLKGKEKLEQMISDLEKEKVTCY